MSWPNLEEPRTLAQLSDLIRSQPRVILRGSESKPALAPALEEDLVVCMRRLSGVVAFNPPDFHITAMGGTPVAEITRVLAGHGQRLPFEPPCFSPESTIGGVVSGNLEGPGALRSRGIKAHLLAAQFCDGLGKILRSGARVLKNSAGLDVARFLAGSLGRFAAITEVTLRTSPLPEATASLAWPCSSLERAIALLQDLESSPWAFEALDLEVAAPDAPFPVVLGRISGRAASVPKRARHIIEASSHPAFPISPEEAPVRWSQRLHLSWVPERHALLKVPLELSMLRGFDDACAALNAVRTYTHAGRLAWVALPAPALFESALRDRGLRGLVVLAPSSFTGSPFIGKWPPSPLMRRLKRLFDPESKFPIWPEADSP